MKVAEYQGADQYGLYAYWRELAASVPYFFPVSTERWVQCLLADELAGERMFDHLTTYVAKDRGQVIGFAQADVPPWSGPCAGTWPTAGGCKPSRRRLRLRGRGRRRARFAGQMPRG